VAFSKRAGVLDFGTSRISALIGKLDRAGSLTVSGSGRAEYAGLRDYQFAEPERVAVRARAALRGALRQAGSLMRDVYVLVPGEFSAVTFSEAQIEIGMTPGIISREDYDRLRVVSRQRSMPPGYRLLHEAPVMFTIDSDLVGGSPVGHKGRLLVGYYSLTSVDKAFCAQVEDALESVGIGVIDFVAAPFSAAKLVGAGVSTKDMSVIVDCGHYSTDVTVLQGDTPVSHTNIPLGGADILSDLALYYGVDIPTAIRISRRILVNVSDETGIIMVKGVAHSLPAQPGRSIVEARLSKLTEQVGAAVRSFGASVNDCRSIYWTGGGIYGIRGAREYIMQCMGAAVREFTPSQAAVNMPEWTAAVGALNWVLRTRK